jgi:hypothetical protein
MELTALQERIDVTPVFEGRSQLRDAIREVIRVREAKPPALRVEESDLAALVQRIVPLDSPTLDLRFKLIRALERDRLLTA